MMNKVDDSKVQKLPQTVGGFVWYYAKLQRVRLVTLFFFAIIAFSEAAFWPVFFKLMTDTAVRNQNNLNYAWQAMMPIFIVGGIIWAAASASERVAGVISTYVKAHMESNIRRDMFDFIADHSHRYFSNTFAGTLSGKVNDMAEGATIIVRSLINYALPTLVRVTILMVIFAYTNKIFSVVIGLWIVLEGVLRFSFKPKISSLAEVHATARNRLKGTIIDSFSNHSSVRSFAATNIERQLVGSNIEDEQSRQIYSRLFQQFMEFLSSILSFVLCYVVLTYFVIELWRRGEISVGDIMLIINGSWFIMWGAFRFFHELPLIFENWGKCHQAIELIRSPHEITDKPHATPLKITDGKIEFDHVEFGYDDNNKEALFKSQSVTIPGGQKIGLVGYSGAGKSTFVNLILRIFDVTDGAITIDDQDIRDVQKDTLRGQIALIPQDTSLFHRSLMDNIRYSRPDASDDEVIEAAKQAHAHDFIIALKDGYDSLVGERGIKLSGGQRQRIAIARAILKNAPILILDEATSSLDSVTEDQIQHTLYDLMEGRTTIVIAHRLSTLSQMDRIIVFDNGKIIEDGTHDELINANGHYARMWTMQAGGFLPDKDGV